MCFALLLLSNTPSKLKVFYHHHLRFKLCENKHPPSYSLGLKEVWQLPQGDERCRPGKVHHTLGWPLQNGPLDTIT